MKTALIIDDDESCRRRIAARLRELGWRVVEGGGGEEGIRLAVEHTPALLLCQLFTPNGNGFQLCRSVREHLDARHTRIVAVSARDYAADRQSATEAGADEFVLLDSLPEALGEIISRVPETSPGGSPAKPAAGPVKLRFWGVRGSIPTPGAGTVRYGGNTSCLELRADGEIIVLDAGTGIRELGLSLAAEFKDAPLSLTVLISHTHWDHIQGFPFFLPAYNPKNRVRILGYEGAREGLGVTLAGQMESPYFPIALKQMPGHIVIEELRDMEFHVGSVRVTSCFSKHPGVCVGYRLFTSAGTIAYVPDNEWSAEDEEGACNGGARNENTHLLQFIQGADVLVIDAQYDSAEYQSHIGWGHGCVDDVVRLAILANVRRLYLFHHDPGHDDARIDAMLEQARAQVRETAGASLEVHAAREGEELLIESELSPT